MTNASYLFCPLSEHLWTQFISECIEREKLTQILNNQEYSNIFYLMVLPQCPNIFIKIHVYSDVEKMEKTTEFRNFTCWQAGRGPVDCSTCPINHIWSCIWAPSTMWPRWGSQNEEFADQSKNLRHFSTLSCPPPCRAKVACFYFPFKLFFYCLFCWSCLFDFDHNLVFLSWHKTWACSLLFGWHLHLKSFDRTLYQHLQTGWTGA